MGKIYLIRHGETNSNLGHKFQGRIDMPLNGNGLQQARKMAKYMADKKIDAIYSSSMLRARMTAAELAMAKIFHIVIWIVYVKSASAIGKVWSIVKSAVVGLKKWMLF